MPINKEQINVQHIGCGGCKGMKFILVDNGRNVGQASLYLIQNDSRGRIYGLLEDLFTEPGRKAISRLSRLAEEAVKAAREHDCYKIIATSRYGRKKMEILYKSVGLTDFGTEFKMYFQRDLKKPV